MANERVYLEGFREQVYVALSHRDWMDVHEIARAVDGPTDRVYQGGRHVEVPRSASGSGWELTLDWLVEHGFAEVKRPDAIVPLGKVWRRRL